MAFMRLVTAQYFDAMGMRIVGGRSFSEPGHAAYPELVVNQEFVRRYFAGTNPLGNWWVTSRAIKLSAW